MAAKRIWVLFSLSLVLALIVGGQPVSYAATAPVPDAPAPAAPSAGRAFSSAGADFMVSLNESGFTSSAVAANPTDDQFLVVWFGEGGLHGQIYSAQGLPVGAAFLISRYGIDPAVAFSTASHEYLVVTSDARQGSGWHIYGQRLSATGELLDNPSTVPVETSPEVNFPIAIGGNYKCYPSIAYNPLADEYLVAWGTCSGEDLNVYGKRVDADGYLLNNTGTPADEHDPLVFFDISTATGGQDKPAVAFNQDDEQYLVVWQDDRDSASAMNNKLFGQRLDADGDLLDNPGTLDADESDPQVNFKLSSQEVVDQIQVVYNRSAHEYLVVFQQGWTEILEIYGQRISRLGALIDNPATTPDESDPAVNYLIRSGETNQSHPRLAYNPIRGEYMLAWQSERRPETDEYEVYGMRLDELLEPKPPEEFALSDSPWDQAIKFLTFNTASQQFLFGLTLDDPNDSWDRNELRVQRVFWPGLLLGNEVTVYGADDDQEDPAVAYNSRDQETLVVWSDRQQEDPVLFFQRYDRDGLPLSGTYHVTMQSSGHIHPAAAYSSLDNQYLVVWESADHHSIQAQLLSGQGMRIRNPITIATGPVGTLYNPAVAFVSKLEDNSYLVVYELDAGSDRTIYAKRVYPDGRLSTNLPVRLTGFCHNPALAYGATDNRLMVVFDYASALGNTTDVMGVFMEPNGTLDVPFWVSHAYDSQAYPSIVWNEEDNQFLVVWHDYRDSGTKGADIFGQRFDSAGLEMGAEIAVSTLSGTSNQQYPQVDYAVDQDTYRVVWQDDRDGGNGWDIRGNWVSRAGAVLHSFDDPIVRLPGWQIHPALRYIPNYQKALVAWQDGRDSEQYDIYASFGAADATPPVSRFTRDPIWGRVGDTFTLNAWPSYDETTPRGALLVRWDFNNDGTWDTDLGPDKYITRTVTTAGVYTIKLEVWDRSFNTSSITRQIAVLPEPVLRPQAEPPVAAMTIDPGSAVAGTAFEFDGSASTGSGALWLRWDWENDGDFETDWSTDLITTHVFTQAGLQTVRMEVRQDNNTGLSDAVTHNLLVKPAALASLEILPAAAELLPGETLQWRLQGMDIFDNVLYNPSASWSLLNAQAGEISASGLFTASLQIGTYAGAVQAADEAVSDTSTVTIFHPWRVLLPVAMKK